MNVGRIVIDFDVAHIYAPFGAKDAIKTLPGRRWDPQDKAWVVPPWLASDAETLLWRYCDEVIVDDRRTPASTPTWAAVLFRAIPVRLRRSTYVALAKVLHPDADGDLRAMQELADAWGTHDESP